MKLSCFCAITSVALTSTTTAQGWSDQERKELQQRLAPLLADSKPDIRLIGCLGYIGDELLVPKLIELLGHEELSIREFSATALGRIGNPRALPLLEHLAETDPHQYENGRYGVREAAIEAIEKIRQEKDGHSASPLVPAELPPLE